MTNSGRPASAYPPAYQEQINAVLNPKYRTPADRRAPSSTESERAVCDAALAPNQGKALYPDRVAVGVKSYRRRLLDEDNLCPKYFIDGLRYAGIISDDDPSKVRLQVSQEQVSKEADERTEITITPL